MVSLQSALLPEPSKRPPCLSLVGGGGGAVASTATSKKRKRDGDHDDGDRENSRGEVVDGIELNFDAAPLPPEWQRCLDIQSGQISYYNTKTQKRTWKDPRGEPEYRAAPAAGDGDEEEESANCAPPGLDLELNLTFSPGRALAHQEKKKPRPAAPPPPPLPAADRRRQPAEAEESGREMVAAVCVRCHMLVMMCRACPNCKFLHTPSRAAPPPEPEPPASLKLGLQLLCCRD